MSSSLLNKRIIVNIAAEIMKSTENSTVEELKLISAEEQEDFPPPVKKSFVGNSAVASYEENAELNSQTVTNTSTMVNDSEILEALYKTENNEINYDPDSTSSKKMTKRLWMTVGDSKREPRVGSDFQASIE